MPVPVLIPSQPGYLDCLHDLVHSSECLDAKGYILSTLSEAELGEKRRCARCHLAKVKKRGRRSSAQKEVSGNTNLEDASTSDIRDVDTLGLEQLKLKETLQQQSRCRFHDGTVVDKRWTCCNERTTAPPCRQEVAHQSRIYAPNELSTLWQFYETPSSSTDNCCKVVVIDCEMGTAASGDSELIRVTLLEYFSGRILIDKLVWPDVAMSHLNTRFSGVTWKALNAARRQKTCIFGKRKARAIIWGFVCPDTIVVGHSTNSDLNALRWIHHRVIDTQIIEGNSSDKTAGLSLKSLSEKRLQRTIQVKGKGHDSLEDALATRDLLHWNVARTINDSASA
ncbi:hypothetical protein FPSE_09990 [Fusarium pseudograminearum CS3096]|uniref:Exonuclease domain-containing protein n=1 Tax=Fusarium pseudograminearum (strain CS3096) TaxID=1028729 RepID=K3VC04_FUSPC|nr:hypothetical protein FPSE_09990 [Fusarium pseudograminearum CS3096]EKJ69833.1 hypothetical protein FPSE_09990 [Fusarium pseudograminearum CS3096]